MVAGLLQSLAFEESEKELVTLSPPSEIALLEDLDTPTSLASVLWVSFLAVREQSELIGGT